MSEGGRRGMVSFVEKRGEGCESKGKSGEGEKGWCERGWLHVGGDKEQRSNKEEEPVTAECLCVAVE